MGCSLGMDLLNSMSSPGCQHVHFAEELAHMNDTSDWYFPLHFRTIGDPSYYCTGVLDHDENPNIPWIWRGVRHLSQTQLELLCLPLPSLNLPLDWIRRCNPRDDIIASTHGLFLLKLETRKVLEMDALRRPFANDRPNLTRWRHPKFLLNCEAGAPNEHWTPLMVYNPLCKEWRILPAVSPQEVGMSVWDYHFVQAHLMVDEVKNSYKVVLVFEQSMCVYNSREKTWACHMFRSVLRWGSIYRGLEGIQPVAWRYQGASACIGGHVLLVDLEIGEETEELHSDGGLIEWRGYLNVFGFDEDLEEVRQIGGRPLQSFFYKDEDEDEDGDEDRNEDENWDEDEVQDETQEPCWNLGFGCCSYSLEVVECMGNLFAIIPTLLVQNWKIRNPHNNFISMPLQFHIFKLGYSQLEETPRDLQVGAHRIHRRGILRIQVPRTQGFINCKCDNCVIASRDRQHPHQNSALWCRHEILYHDAMKSHKSRLNKNWFRCTAKGSVIWMSVHDYLLQHDVVSGESKTEIVSDLFGRNEQFCGAVCEYRPSFHMKP